MALTPEQRLHELVQDTLRGPALESLPFFDQRKVVALLDSLPAMDDGRADGDRSGADGHAQRVRAAGALRAGVTDCAPSAFPLSRAATLPSICFLRLRGADRRGIVRHPDVGRHLEVELELLANTPLTPGANSTVLLPGTRPQLVSSSTFFSTNARCVKIGSVGSVRAR